MKKTLALLILIGMLLTSCSWKENEAALELLRDIQSMGDTLPKEAILRLNQIKPLFKKETEYMRNKFALLDIRLHDKAYITHTSDSTIKELCKFFEEHGTAKELQETYYYMGSVYRDLNDYPRAVTYFLKSVKIAENNVRTDYTLQETAYSQLSYLYNMQFNYTEALNTALNGLKVAEEHNMADERTYMNVASRYFRLNDTLQTIKYTDIAIDIIDKKNSYSKNYDIIASAMGKYAVFGYLKKAEHCRKMLERVPVQSKPFNYLINLSIFYENENSIDSAAMLRKELYKVANNIEAKYDAAKWLTLHYYAKEEYEITAEYAVKFIEANEIIVAKRDFENTTNAKNVFQYQRDKEEELKIIKREERTRLYLMVFILGFVIFLFVGISIHYRRKKMLLELIINKEENIKHVKSTVKQKEQELESLNSTNAELTRQLHNAKNEFKMLLEQNCELTKISLMNNAPDNAKEIIEKVRKTARGKYRLSDEEWKELLGAIDSMFPEFTYEVQSKFKKISEPVMRVCYLMKIGLSAPEIVNITNYPRQTVWDRVKRIEKIMQTDKISTQE